MGIARFINKNLFIIVIVVICFALVLGYIYPNSGQYLEKFYPLSLFLMIYPMMVGLKFSEIAFASKRIGFLILIIIFNFIVSPLLAAFLGHLFLADYVDFAVGLIVNGTVPCGGMIVAWTAMSKGNVPMTVVLMVVSMLAGIVLIPLCIWILVGKYVPVDALEMFQNIVVTIVVPLVLGILTGKLLIKKWGQERFDKITPIFSAISGGGMFMVFCIAMASQSVALINNPHYLAVITLPLICFYLLLSFIIMVYARLFRINYPDMVSFYYGVGSKNSSVALAIAVVSFSSLTVLILAARLIIQLGFLIGFLKLSPYIQTYWSKVIPITEKTVT
ncbi:MAG: bile acid:sodium symporter [Dehalobacterium sp.]